MCWQARMNSVIQIRPTAWNQVRYWRGPISLNSVIPVSGFWTGSPDHREKWGSRLAHLYFLFVICVTLCSNQWFPGTTAPGSSRSRRSGEPRRWGRAAVQAVASGQRLFLPHGTKWWSTPRASSWKASAAVEWSGNTEFTLRDAHQHQKDNQHGQNTDILWIWLQPPHRQVVSDYSLCLTPPLPHSSVLLSCCFHLDGGQCIATKGCWFQLTRKKLKDKLAIMCSIKDHCASCDHTQRSKNKQEGENPDQDSRDEPDHKHEDQGQD